MRIETCGLKNGPTHPFSKIPASRQYDEDWNTMSFTSVQFNSVIPASRQYDEDWNNRYASSIWALPLYIPASRQYDEDWNLFKNLWSVKGCRFVFQPVASMMRIETGLILMVVIFLFIPASRQYDEDWNQHQ